MLRLFTVNVEAKSALHKFKAGANQRELRKFPNEYARSF